MGAPTPAPMPAPTPQPALCSDENQSCEGWAALGECETNPGYMLENCRKSCGVCSLSAAAGRKALQELSHEGVWGARCTGSFRPLTFDDRGHSAKDCTFQWGRRHKWVGALAASAALSRTRQLQTLLATTFECASPPEKIV